MKRCIQRLSLTTMKCSSKRKEDGSVAVYFTQYKRNYIAEQLKALNRSTTVIKELIIYQGEQHLNYGSVLKEYPFIKHIWTTNWNNPFFLRFLIPFMVDSYYIINLDDDILTQKRTLDSMIDVVKNQDAVTAFEGRIVKKLDFVKSHLNQQVVYSTPDKYQIVDFLVISYAMKLEYVKIFWRYRYMMERNGEDIHLSASNKIECNRPSMIRIKTEDSGFDKINDDKGASLKPTHFHHRGLLLRAWIMSGYDIINKQALVHFPSMTNQSTEYYRNRIRYRDYEFDVCSLSCESILSILHSLSV